MIAFLNKNNSIDPLIKMAIAHYQFEAIHPFVDGNGRTGRVLNLLYLVDQKLLSHPVLYLTKYMKELVELGVLSSIEDGREVFYINNDLIRILKG